MKNVSFGKVVYGLVSIALLSTLPAQAGDDSLQLPPGAPQAIGSNFDPSAVKNKKIQCAENVRPGDVHDNMQNATSIDIQEVRSERELAQKLGFSAEVNARYGKSAMVYAVYTLKNASSAQKEQIGAAIRLAASGVTGSVEAKAKYQQSMSELNSSSNLSVQIKLVGGTGVVDAADVIPSTYNLSEFQSTVVKYLKGITLANGYSVETFSTSIFDAVGGQEPPLRVRKIAEYEKARMKLYDRIDQLSEILDAERSIKYDDMPASKRKLYRKLQQEHKATLQALDRRAELCEKSYGKDVAKNCVDFDVTLADLEMPTNGCDIPGCSKCSANNECLVCQIKPATEFGGSLDLAYMVPIELSCPKMPANAEVTVTASGTVTQRARHENMNYAHRWLQTISLTDESGASSKNPDYALGDLNASQRSLTVPALRTKTAATGGTFRVKLTNIQSDIWPTHGGLAATLASDFTVTIVARAPDDERSALANARKAMSGIALLDGARSSGSPLLEEESRSAPTGFSEKRDGIWMRSSGSDAGQEAAI
ncbi:MAG: hypothetical protein HY075_02110 [Deltaproteobacteria bacterium]|nr:hypothetical protein [Deltaproteobacteria bacterium]